VELRFWPAWEKHVFKLHLQVETWFGRFFRGACNRLWNVLLWKDTHAWANEVLMIIELQVSRSTKDVLTLSLAKNTLVVTSGLLYRCKYCHKTKTRASRCYAQPLIRF
jgi:hypothetical protein